MHDASRGPFRGPRRRRGSCWEERKRSLSPTRGSLICPPGKSMIFRKIETQKKWVSVQQTCSNPFLLGWWHSHHLRCVKRRKLDPGASSTLLDGGDAKGECHQRILPSILFVRKTHLLGWGRSCPQQRQPNLGPFQRGGLQPGSQVRVLNHERAAQTLVRKKRVWAQQVCVATKEIACFLYQGGRSRQGQARLEVGYNI